MTIAELGTELEKYYKYVKASYNEEDGNLLNKRITYCNGIIARSSEMLSWAQYYLDQARGEVATEIANQHTATVFREVLNARTANETRLCKLTERLNSTVKHQLDGLRSQLSYLKSFND